MIRRIISFILIVTFTLTSVVSPSSAQTVSPIIAQPSQMLSPSVPVFSGIKIYPQEPFRFDFLVDGQSSLVDRTSQTHDERRTTNDELLKLIKYFMASLTVPEGDLWVNLSPYEPDRIVPQALGQTEMGRDLLAQDYILKQLTASLMSPEGESGKKFWEKVYEKIYASGIGHLASGEPNANDQMQDAIQTFNKVWIVPDKVEVYQNGDVAYITNARLKVMLESDYLAQQQSKLSSPNVSVGDLSLKDISTKDNGFPTKAFGNDSIKNIIRDTIIPLIEDEVNNGESFANLRQIFHSMILAKWYESHFKNSILGQSYVDRNIISGIELSLRGSEATKQSQKDGIASQKTLAMTVEGIYNQYVAAFKSGAADLIKEEYDPTTQNVVTRKYFTGGFNGLTNIVPVSEAMMTRIQNGPSRRIVVELQRPDNLPIEDDSNLARMTLKEDPLAARNLIKWMDAHKGEPLTDAALSIPGHQWSDSAMLGGDNGYPTVPLKKLTVAPEGTFRRMVLSALKEYSELEKLFSINTNVALNITVGIITQDDIPMMSNPVEFKISQSLYNIALKKFFETAGLKTRNRFLIGLAGLYAYQEVRGIKDSEEYAKIASANGVEPFSSALLMKSSMPSGLLFTEAKTRILKVLLVKQSTKTMDSLNQPPMIIVQSRMNSLSDRDFDPDKWLNRKMDAYLKTLLIVSSVYALMPIYFLSQGILTDAILVGQVFLPFALSGLTYFGLDTIKLFFNSKDSFIRHADNITSVLEIILVFQLGLLAMSMTSIGVVIQSGEPIVSSLMFFAFQMFVVWHNIQLLFWGPGYTQEKVHRTDENFNEKNRTRFQNVYGGLVESVILRMMDRAMMNPGKVVSSYFMNVGGKVERRVIRGELFYILSLIPVLKYYKVRQDSRVLINRDLRFLMGIWYDGMSDVERGGISRDEYIDEVVPVWSKKFLFWSFPNNITQIYVIGIPLQEAAYISMAFPGSAPVVLTAASILTGMFYFYFKKGEKINRLSGNAPEYLYISPEIDEMSVRSQLWTQMVGYAGLYGRNNQPFEYIVRDIFNIMGDPARIQDIKRQAPASLAGNLFGSGNVDFIFDNVVRTSLGGFVEGMPRLDWPAVQFNTFNSWSYRQSKQKRSYLGTKDFNNLSSNIAKLILKRCLYFKPSSNDELIKLSMHYVFLMMQGKRPNEAEVILLNLYGPSNNLNAAMMTRVWNIQKLQEWQIKVITYLQSFQGGSRELKNSEASIRKLMDIIQRYPNALSLEIFAGKGEMAYEKAKRHPDKAFIVIDDFSWEDSFWKDESTGETGLTLGQDQDNYVFLGADVLKLLSLFPDSFFQELYAYHPNVEALFALKDQISRILKFGGRFAVYPHPKDSWKFQRPFYQWLHESRFKRYAEHDPYYEEHGGRFSDVNPIIYTKMRRKSARQGKASKDEAMMTTAELRADPSESLLRGNNGDNRAPFFLGQTVLSENSLLYQEGGDNRIFVYAKERLLPTTRRDQSMRKVRLELYFSRRVLDLASDSIAFLSEQSVVDRTEVDTSDWSYIDFEEKDYGWEMVAIYPVGRKPSKTFERYSGMGVMQLILDYVRGALQQRKDQDTETFIFTTYPMFRQFVEYYRRHQEHLEKFTVNIYPERVDLDLRNSEVYKTFFDDNHHSLYEVKIPGSDEFVSATFQSLGNNLYRENNNLWTGILRINFPDGIILSEDGTRIGRIEGIKTCFGIRLKFSSNAAAMMTEEESFWLDRDIKSQRTIENLQLAKEGLMKNRLQAETEDSPENEMTGVMGFLNESLDFVEYFHDIQMRIAEIIGDKEKLENPELLRTSKAVYVKPEHAHTTVVGDLLTDWNSQREEAEGLLRDSVKNMHETSFTGIGPYLTENMSVIFRLSANDNELFGLRESVAVWKQQFNSKPYVPSKIYHASMVYVLGEDISQDQMKAVFQKMKAMREQKTSIRIPIKNVNISLGLQKRVFKDIGVPLALKGHDDAALSAPGGIDMNNLNMQTSGQATQLEIPASGGMTSGNHPAMMNQSLPYGLVPRIISITNVSTYDFLGLNKNHSDHGDDAEQISGIYPADIRRES